MRISDWSSDVCSSDLRGYGPDYKLPGLSHRTGHGIGLDGHEPVNLVRGETTKLAPGMCFSNEPGIYIPGQFGFRLEDCFYMTEAGPKYLSDPPERKSTRLNSRQQCESRMQSFAKKK